MKMGFWLPRWLLFGDCFLFLFSTALPSPIILLPGFFCLCSHPTGGGGGKGGERASGCMDAWLLDRVNLQQTHCFTFLLFILKKYFIFPQSLRMIVIPHQKMKPHFACHFPFTTWISPRQFPFVLFFFLFFYADKNTFSHLVIDRTP